MEEKFAEFRKCLRDDMARLLHLYNQKDSFRYSEFVKVWNELKFYQLLTLFYYYPLNYRDFIKDALKIAIEYLCDNLDLEVRAGALYLLYGIYFLQIELPKMKISVTHDQWTEVSMFIGMVTEDEENVDVDYIFRVLLHSDAFEFCAVSNDIKGITNQYMAQKPRNRRDDYTVNMNAILDDFKRDLLGDSLINELTTIHEKYVEMKADLTSGPTASVSGYQKVLNTINQDIDDVLGFGTTNERDDEVDKTTQNEDEDGEDGSDAAEEADEKPPKIEESVLSRRMRVRQKAAKLGTASKD